MNGTVPESSPVAPASHERRSLDSLAWRVLVAGFLLIMVDGFDLAALAYSSPFIIAEWQLGSKAQLAAAFSAGLAGMCIGAPLLGQLADRAGRRRAIVVSALITGFFSAATAMAESTTALLWLRMLAGIGMGGLASCLIAYTAEHMPVRIRAFMTCVMFCGITVGAALPGFLTAWLVPTHGWQILFIGGGLAAALGGVLFYFVCPESQAFLSARDRVREERAKGGASGTSAILGPELRLMSVLLWLCIALAFVGYYGVSSWLPTILVGLGYAPTSAALGTAVMQLGGVAGGLAVSALVDRYGAAPVAISALACVGVLVLAGTLSSSGLGMHIYLLLVGAALLGSQFGLTVLAGILYPTHTRGTGVGWASSVGRIGAIFGPLAGGALIDGGVAGTNFLLAAAVPYVALAGVAFWLHATSGDWLRAMRSDKQ
jgi:MFS transporter, AAHS family, 4-hydroxybenzoate transporter